MKTTFKTFAIALAFIATAFTAQAEDKETKKASGFGTGIYTTKSGNINVMVEKANTDASTTIALKTEKGAVVYEETVGKKNKRFGRSLNVADLKPGTYEIEVSNQGEKLIKTFELSTSDSQRIIQVK